MGVWHFLLFMDYSSEELIGLIHHGSELKDLRNRDVFYEPLRSRALSMVLEKASTRIRLFFEAGVIQLGGQVIFLPPRDTQPGCGEPIGDSTRVMSRMLDDVMIHTLTHATLTEFAAHSKVPAISSLSNGLHLCQLSADVQILHEHRGSIQGKAVVWIGDCNSMYNSYVEAALEFDSQLHVACLKDYEPKAELVVLTGDRLRVIHDPREAVAGAHLVSTNIRTSTGQEDEAAVRVALFRPHQVNAALLDRTVDDVLFMHYLPTHRDEGISEELLSNPCPVAWDQAGNHLHTQKALLELLIEYAHYA